MSNTITAYFKGRVGVAESVYQNDYGIVMAFDSIDLPAHFDCYFSVPGSDTATAAVGVDNRVAIPNSVLGNSGNMSVHIPLHTGANDSEVEYVAYFKVIGRARPEDDGTPAQMTAIEQALALLQTPISNIEEIVNEALSFTGQTFEEMRAELLEDYIEGMGAFRAEVGEDISNVESDFDILNAQYQVAVSALTEDSEVQNVRVGDDGVTYSSAGDAVRKQFADVKEEILNNAYDVFAMYQGDSGTHKGITFSYGDNKCTLSGTATADAFRNLYYSLSALPFGVKAGEKYYVKYSTPNEKARLTMYFYDANEQLVGTSQYITADRTVTIPAAAVGMAVRIQVLSGTVLDSAIIVYFHMMNTLTNKALEDEIQSNTEAVMKYSARNVLYYGQQQTKTHNSTTFTWNDSKDVCQVSCSATSHSVSLCNIYYSVSSLPAAFEPGEKYYLKYSTTKPSGQRCICDIWVFRNGNTDISNPDINLNEVKDAFFTLPEDATGIVIRLRLIANYVTDETIKIALLNAQSNAALENVIQDDYPYYGYKEYAMSDGTSNGVTFTFDVESNRCHAVGTASGTSFRNVYYNISKLPDGLNVGDKFILHFATSNIHLACAVYFRLSDNTDYQAVAAATMSRIITVPENAVGMWVRYVVYNGYTIDDDAVIPLMVKMKNQTILPFKAKRPLMVSIIDDDTSTDELVTKFYQACKHNGVVGAYAVCTKQYIDGTSTISQLLDYEADGFDMIPHCLEQKQYLHPTHEDYDPVLAFKNYAQCIRDFRTLGLINPQNMWVIPYGSSDDETIAMAKRLGFEMSFSVQGSQNNYLTMNDKYRLFRRGFSQLSNVSDDTDPTVSGSLAMCKQRVDELVESETGGWLIFMTHFNEWQDEVWDATLDANGYPIGYTRFNELIQYVKESGCDVVSMAEGAAFMKPIIDRNFTMG